jgi:hypothetical protein
MKNKDILALIQKYVRNDIDTTEVQGSDSLDFHDVYIKSLVDLINAAYEKGRDKGYVEGLEAAQEMAAVYSRECGV